MRLLVLASGRGSNFEAILEASKKGILPVKITGLLCDRDCNAVNIARAGNIPVTILKPKDYPQKEIYIKELIDVVSRHDPDYIVLAGYMRILPSELIDLYPLKIVNIHPSLLPDFKGKDAIKQAWDAGVRTTGVTVHFVNDKMDAGLIIAQEKVQVPASQEELEENIHKVEHCIYIDVIKMIATKLNCVIVSKCLLGDNVRYDGTNKYSKRTETYIKNFKGKIINICPEVLAGLGVPRPSMNMVGDRVLTSEGQDFTNVLRSAIKRIIEDVPQGSRVIAILKEKSPCCGKNAPEGLLTKELLKNFNDVLIVNEEEL